MPKILDYGSSIKVSLLRNTESPADIVGTAAAITTKSDLATPLSPMNSKGHKYLLDADHTSLLEHVSYTFLLEGVSRSFLAQVTRHRMSSFTSGSQHYQDYTSYPCVVSKEIVSDDVTIYAMHITYASYNKLTAQGVPKEEARQVLPNASTVNIMWTINARSLVNFLKLRLCKRNVMETRIVATRILKIVRDHYPELFNHVGPQCFMDQCKQGFMRCGEEPWK